MRFLVDMPLSPALAEWLRNHGHDAIHAIEQGLNRAPDGEILSRAEQQQRTIVTADLDYPRLLAITRATAPGLILFRSGDWSDAEVIGRMSAVLENSAEAEITRSIVVVERHRIRRRRLPLV